MSGYPPPPSYGSADPMNKGHYYNPNPSFNGGNIPYAQPPSGFPPQTSTAGPDGKFDFSESPKYPDLWATILFLINSLAFIALSVVGINHLVNEPADSSTSPGNDPSNDPQQTYKPTSQEKNSLVIVLCVFTVISAVLAGLYVVLMRKFPRQLITTTFILSIILTFAMAAFFIYVGATVGAVIYIIIGIIYIICYIFWRKYIPFTAAMLETVVEIGNKYPASYLFAFLSLVIGCVYQIWWVATVAGIVGKYQVDNQTTSTILLVYLVFTFYWTGQVLKNTLHVTVAGTVASFFFLEGTSAMPANPTLQAAKRAFTTSFGPIAFGSLLVAILKTIRWLLRQAARNGSIIALFVGCFLGCIEQMVEYFNEYAYVQVAIYGKSFCDAAKDTIHLIKSTGFEMIINDNLVGSVLGIGTILLGLIAGAGGYLTCHFIFNETQRENLSGYILGVAIVLFLIGVLMMSIIGMYIHSGVQTIYVSLAEDPAALARTKPQLYERFKQTYPTYHWRL